MIKLILIYVAWIAIAYLMDWHARQDRKSRTTTFSIHGVDLANDGDWTMVTTWTTMDFRLGNYNLGKGRLHYMPHELPAPGVYGLSRATRDRYGKGIIEALNRLPTIHYTRSRPLSIQRRPGPALRLN